MEASEHTLKLHVSVNKEERVWTKRGVTLKGTDQAAGLSEAPARLWWSNHQQEAPLFILGLTKGAGHLDMRGGGMETEETGKGGEGCRGREGAKEKY